MLEGAGRLWFASIYSGSVKIRSCMHVELTKMAAVRVRNLDFDGQECKELFRRAFLQKSVSVFVLYSASCFRYVSVVLVP